MPVAKRPLYVPGQLLVMALLSFLCAFPGMVYSLKNLHWFIVCFQGRILQPSVLHPSPPPSKVCPWSISSKAFNPTSVCGCAFLLCTTSSCQGCNHFQSLTLEDSCSKRANVGMVPGQETQRCCWPQQLVPR